MNKSCDNCIHTEICIMHKQYHQTFYKFIYTSGISGRGNTMKAARIRANETMASLCEHYKGPLDMRKIEEVYNKEFIDLYGRQSKL